MVYAISKRIFYPIFSLFIKRIEGIENLPSGQCIYVFNHQSYLDGFLIPLLVAWHQNKKVYIFATNAKFTNWIWNKLFDHFGAMRVGGSMETALARFRDGYSLAIAPEGGRSPIEAVQPIKHTGLGVVALKTKAHIVPIGLDTWHFWNKYNYLPRFNKTITLAIGKPMRFSLKLTPKNVKNTIETVMKEVKHLAKTAHALSTAQH